MSSIENYEYITSPLYKWILFNEDGEGSYPPPPVFLNTEDEDIQLKTDLNTINNSCDLNSIRNTNMNIINSKTEGDGSTVNLEGKGEGMNPIHNEPLVGKNPNSQTISPNELPEKSQENYFLNKKRKREVTDSEHKGTKKKNKKKSKEENEPINDEKSSKIISTNNQPREDSFRQNLYPHDENNELIKKELFKIFDESPSNDESPNKDEELMKKIYDIITSNNPNEELNMIFSLQYFDPKKKVIIRVGYKSEPFLKYIKSFISELLTTIIKFLIIVGKLGSFLNKRTILLPNSHSISANANIKYNKQLLSKEVKNIFCIYKNKQPGENKQKKNNELIKEIFNINMESPDLSEEQKGALRILRKLLSLPFKIAISLIYDNSKDFEELKNQEKVKIKEVEFERTFHYKLTEEYGIIKYFEENKGNQKKKLFKVEH